MRSCVCSDSPRPLHFPLLLTIFSLIILSFLLPINFIFQDVVDKLPVHPRERGPWHSCRVRPSHTRPRLDKISSRPRHTFCTGRGFDLTLRGVRQSGSWCSGDTKTAFLSGDAGAPYTSSSYLPVMFETFWSSAQSKMLRLCEAVYGLVNAPKKWWDRLQRSLLNHGFTS